MKKNAFHLPCFAIPILSFLFTVGVILTSLVFRTELTGNRIADSMIWVYGSLIINGLFFFGFAFHNSFLHRHSFDLLTVRMRTEVYFFFSVLFLWVTFILFFWNLKQVFAVLLTGITAIVDAIFIFAMLRLGRRMTRSRQTYRFSN